MTRGDMPAVSREPGTGGQRTVIRRTAAVAPPVIPATRPVAAGPDRPAHRRRATPPPARPGRRIVAVLLWPTVWATAAAGAWNAWTAWWAGDPAQLYGWLAATIGPLLVAHLLTTQP